jgi:hydrogenase nickel incorporation protein HypA/HybF
MHELGVVFEVVKSVEDFARQNGLTRIDTVVLQVGELSSIIPKYLEDCFPAAVDGTMLEETKLRIEVLPGNARCHACGATFNLIQEKSLCPSCGARDWEIVSGREFLIKEVLAC